MSRQVSPSTDRVYGLQRMTRIWGVSRATIYPGFPRWIGVLPAPCTEF